MGLKGGMRSLRSFLPEPDEKDNKVMIIQARVTPRIATQIRTTAKKYGWRPSDVVRAGLLKFLEDERTCPEQYKLPEMNLKPTQANSTYWKG